MKPLKPRPKALWFLGPAGCILVAVAVFAVGLLLTLRSATHVDATFAAQGQPEAVALSHPGKQMIMSNDLTTQCQVIGPTGHEVPVTDSVDSFTRSDSHGTFNKVGVFTTSSPSVSITCRGADPGSMVEIGPSVDLGHFIGGVLATILLPMLFGGLGLIWLLVLTILFFTRPGNLSGAGASPPV